MSCESEKRFMESREAHYIDKKLLCEGKVAEYNSAYYDAAGSTGWLGASGAGAGAGLYFGVITGYGIPIVGAIVIGSAYNTWRAQGRLSKATAAKNAAYNRMVAAKGFYDKAKSEYQACLQRTKGAKARKSGGR